MPRGRRDKTPELPLDQLSWPFYDPRNDGADCDHCPMKRWGETGAWGFEGWRPVPGKQASGEPEGIMMGEAPASREVQEGYPFAGPSGKELNEALVDVAVQRARWDVTNVICCRAPKDNFDLINTLWLKDKRGGRAPDWERHPQVHCRPRMLKELARSTQIIPMGAKAISALLGHATAIQKIRGGPMALVQEGSTFRRDDALDDLLRTQQDLPAGTTRVLPTFHPSFVRRERRWRKVFRADLRKAIRLFRGQLTWKDPVIYYGPTPEQLEWFLAQPSRFWSYDVETDSKEALTAELRCLSIVRDATPQERLEHGVEDAGMVVYLWSLDLMAPFYEPWVEQKIKGILARVLADGRMWVGQNHGYYDRLVVENHLNVTPAPIADTMMYHRLVDSELPHGLGVIGSIYTDVTAWKQDNEGIQVSTGARTDHELGKYCAIDSAVCHRVLPILSKEVQEKGQRSPCPARPSITLLELDHQIQGVCVGLHRTGMRIDPHKQREVESAQEAKVEKRRRKMQEVAESHGWEGKAKRKGGIVTHAPFNPASFPQVAKLLYQVLDLVPVSYTDAGDPSTDDLCLRTHLMDPAVPEGAKEVIRTQRAFRQAHKALTSFLRPLRRVNGEPWIGADGKEKHGVVWPDGRLYTNWKAHGTVTGRLSSSDPMNLQNWPKFMRALVVPNPGNILVGADFDQLEARIAAARWNIRSYLKAFDDQLDAHQITMHFAFGDRIWTLPGAPPPEHRFHKSWPTGPWGPAGEIGGKFDELRGLAKRFFYGSQYGAGAETVYELIREAEDKDGNFVHADLQLAEVVAMRERFFTECSEYKTGWEAEVNHFNSYGYIQEDITGRRRFFLNGFEQNEVVNFSIQAGGAGLENLATLDIVEMFPFGYAGHGTGLIQQGHDSLVLEVPERDGDRAEQAMTDVMTQHYPEIYNVVFSAEARQGMTWKAVG